VADRPQRSSFFARIRTRDLIQAFAALLAIVLAANGARILNDSPPSQDLYLDNFDQAALWLGLALLALIVAALPPMGFRPAAIRETARKIWDDHYLEALIFAGLVGIAVFMRFFRFQDTLPPEIGLCCEEYINGGVAYDALHGDRPLLYPLTRWTSAFGFLVLGETTLGLRFFFPVMGIASLIAFYFLLRELVRAQAALFGLALFALAWWPSLRNRQTTAGTLYAVLFALFLIRAIKTRNPLWALAAGVIAGLISYEYEAFRPVPIIAIGFLTLAGARIVLFGDRLAAARERLTDLVRAAWRPALCFLLAAGIVLVPMIVGTHQGKNLYLTSVDRNVDTRGGERLADEWQDQLRWATTMFLPFTATDYPTSPPRDIPDTPLFDPVTASFVAAGFALALLFFLRGYRAWFVMWVSLILVGGALLLGEFAPWSFFGLVPVLLALAAYFVDDVQTFLDTRFGQIATRGLTAALLLALGLIVWWNTDTLFNDIESDPEIQRVYGGEISFMYAMCDYLRDRPDGNFAVTYSNAVRVPGFAIPRETAAEERFAWNDFIWACHGLEGAALPSALEAWPLRDLPDGPASLMFADPVAPADQLIAELNAAYPDIGQPDHRITGPGDTYELLAYDFANSGDLQRHGLWGTYTTDGSAEPALTQLDPMIDFELTTVPLEPPYAARWTGLIYVDEARTAELRTVSDFSIEILVDGETGPAELLPGWHAVEIMLDVDEPDLVVTLLWEDEAGSTTAVEPGDLFPLEELAGWRHTRSMGLGGTPDQLVTQRFDFSPHLALASVLRDATGSAELVVTEERWEGLVTLEEATTLTLESAFRGGTVSILVDGAVVGVQEASSQGEDTLLQTSAQVGPGAHTIELIQTLEREPTWSGATLSIRDDRGGTPVVRPY